MTQKYLFLFTIGPVQSFIAQARKTQDLYAGSRILSDLIGFAMDKLETLSMENTNVDFIFPTKDSESKPNRFSAIVSTDKDIQEIGNQVKKATENYFTNVLGKKVTDLQPDSILQLNDFLKIYWVAVPFDENKDYPIQIKQAEKYLGATKNIRYFNQLEEKGRKCALNGEYNVKFYRLGDSDVKNAVNQIRKSKANDKYEPTQKEINNYIIKNKLFIDDEKSVCVILEDDDTIPLKLLQGGEGICAVSMLKRFFEFESNKVENFPSTAKIALLDTLEKNQISQNYIGIVRSLNRGYADEQIYYEDNLTKKYFQKQGYKRLLDNANYISLKQNFDSMKHSIKSDKLVLSKYYAILVFDADGMGDKLAECKTKEEHQNLSKLLGEYGKSATKYIDTNKLGQTIYAGGDDFLGFLNLNHLFEAMQKLREMFNLEVNTHLREDLKLTFSAGVAIAHYKMPLSEVLNYARIMEKKAKKVETKNDNKLKKNAFAIAVLKHSGEIHDTTFRWKEGENWSTEILKNLTNHLKNKDISDNFISNLSSEFAKLLDKNGGWGEKVFSEQENSLNAIFEHELVRFTKRAIIEEKSIDKDFCKKLNTLYLNHCAFDLNVQNFLNALHICEFISRHLNKDKTTTKNIPQTQTI